MMFDRQGVKVIGASGVEYQIIAAHQLTKSCFRAEALPERCGQFRGFPGGGLAVEEVRSQIGELFEGGKDLIEEIVKQRFKGGGRLGLAKKRFDILEVSTEIAGNADGNAFHPRP